MIIKSVHVGNFRSVLDERIDCHSLTVLVGRNGTGKSPLLRAIKEMFYDPKSTVSVQDSYAEDTSTEIEIAVTFTDLGTKEKSIRHGHPSTLHVFRHSAPDREHLEEGTTP